MGFRAATVAMTNATAPNTCVRWSPATEGRPLGGVYTAVTPRPATTGLSIWVSFSSVYFVAVYFYELTGIGAARIYNEFYCKPILVRKNTNAI